MRSIALPRTGKLTATRRDSRGGRLRFEWLEPRMLLNGDIQGLKWLDLDADGAHGTDEPGIPEWTIYLERMGSTTDAAGRLATQTDENGEYLFSNLPDGTYVVSEEMPDGWIQTAPGPQAMLSDVTTYQVGEGQALDFQFLSATVMDYADTASSANRMPVDVTIEVVWPDWCWSVRPEQTTVSVDGSRINISVFGRNSRFCPEIAGPKVETCTVTLPSLRPDQYSMSATLYERDVLQTPTVVAPSLGTAATLSLSAAGTYIVEVPGDPTFAPRHFDFGNRPQQQQSGPYIVSHDPSCTGSEIVPRLLRKTST